MANLRLEHIYKVYPNGTKAVSDFTMDIEDKEFIVFVGPSGCGKSTTLRMIAGLEDISAGELYIDGKVVNDMEPKDRDIAMVFQNYALYPHMTVYENMAFGLKLRHVPTEEIHEKVLWAAKVLDLTDYLDRKPRAMSGGQRQRVALGRSILRNPKVMLLDEPLSNLDAKLRGQMRTEIAKLHDQLQTTFIYVTHDQVEAMTLGTRVVVMRLGRIMQIDTPKNLYDYPDNLFVAGFIGTPQMNFFKATMIKNGTNVDIKFLYSDEVLTIPHALLSKVKQKYFDGQTEVTVGVRCEHLSIEEEVVEKSKYLINAKISHFEELGNETLIYADINKDGDGFGETNTRVIIKSTSDHDLKKDQMVKVAVNVNKMHIFDSVTENNINPRVPQESVVEGVVKGKELSIDGVKFKVPSSIELADGTYDLTIPTSALLLSEGSQKVSSVEKVGKTQVLSFKLKDQVLFATCDSSCETKETYGLGFDFTQLEFIKDGKVVKGSIAKYDKINSMFINHETAKGFVGDKYDELLKNRISAVEEKFGKLIGDLNSKHESDLAAANKGVDASANAAKVAEAKAKLQQELKAKKAEFKEQTAKVTEQYKNTSKEEAQKVWNTYEDIKNKEIADFETFKQINKDKDAYRKRAIEFRDFKSNFALERKNEVEKKLNACAIDRDTELSTIKGEYKRQVRDLKKEYNELVLACDKENNPQKYIDKDYKAELAKLTEQYKMEKTLAGILFFFKTGDLVTLSSDVISNKMIQSLGIKVFTKQYILEIPHDAYMLSDEGIEVEVKELLDYETKRFLHCVYDNGTSQSDLYVETELKEVADKTIKLAFDVNKIHVTEKSLDIKIY